MNDLLLLGLSLSLSGSLVALTLILLKPLLRRFSKTWQYYLWLLVILRLLIPFSPDVSVVNRLFQQVERQSVVRNETAENVPQIDFSGGVQPPVTPDVNVSPMESLETINIFAALKNHIWSTLWLIIAMILLVRKIVGYGRFSKTVKRESKMIPNGQLPAMLQMVSTAMGIKRKTGICINSLVRAPMLIGFINPIIVLPKETMPSSEMIFILRHELTHCRRMDFLYKWLAEIAVCLHWFNPFAYWVRKQVSQDCEFSCDEAVMACLGVEERQTYGDTLLNAIAISHLGKTEVTSLSLNKDGKIIKERLSAIMLYQRKSKLIVLIAAVVTSVLLCGTVYAGAYTVAENVDTMTKGKQFFQNGANTQAIVYENVEMRQYEGYPESDVKGFPYVHHVLTNHTDKKIVSTKRGMMAFDQWGNPLIINWNGLDSGNKPSYFFLYDWGDGEILPNQTEDNFGGWTLNMFGTDYNVDRIAYVLYCDQEITFEAGAVWTNPDFEKWRSTYEGEKIDVNILENYYPFEQKILSSEKVDVDHSQEYLEWHIRNQNDAYYYEKTKLRIFMDLNSDNSFERFVFNDEGSLDLKIHRNDNGTIEALDIISQEEASQIMKDMGISFTNTIQQQIKPAKIVAANDEKAIVAEGVVRLTIDDVSPDLQAAIHKCENSKWYVLESNGRQYIYCNKLPHNYAYQYQPSKKTVAVLDIGTAASHYVLLSVPLGFDLVISYNSKIVSYIKAVI